MVSYLITEVLRNNKPNHSKKNKVHSKLMFKLVLNVYDHFLISLNTSRNPFIIVILSLYISSCVFLMPLILSHTNNLFKRTIPPFHVDNKQAEQQRVTDYHLTTQFSGRKYINRQWIHWLIASRRRQFSRTQITIHRNTVYTVASQNGLGEVLYQYQGKMLRVIGHLHYGHSHKRKEITTYMLKS